MNFDQANRERDKRLRRSLLTTLDNARRFGITGDIDGVTLQDVAKSGLPPEQAFEDDDHCIRLIRSLCDKGLAEEKHTVMRRGERFGLRHMRIKITAEGMSLLNETRPVDPDIDDERLSEER